MRIRALCAATLPLLCLLSSGVHAGGAAKVRLISRDGEVNRQLGTAQVELTLPEGAPAFHGTVSLVCQMPGTNGRETARYRKSVSLPAGGGRHRIPFTLSGNLSDALNVEVSVQGDSIRLVSQDSLLRYAHRVWSVAARPLGESEPQKSIAIPALKTGLAVHAKQPAELPSHVADLMSLSMICLESAALRESLSPEQKAALAAYEGAGGTVLERIPRTDEAWEKAFQQSRIRPTLDTDEDGAYRAFYSAPLEASKVSVPPPWQVAGFLGAYLFCVVPLTYVVLRRRGKREWAWATTPALAMTFATGAALIARQGKPTEATHSLASIIEVGPGGEAVATASIALYAPRPLRTDISLPLPESRLWSPPVVAGATTFGPLTIDQSGPSDIAQGVGIPMWSTRIVAAKTRLTLGQGVAIELRREGETLTGFVENRTGLPIRQATFGAGKRTVPLGDLAPGQRVPITVPISPGFRYATESAKTPWEPSSAPGRIAQRLSGAVHYPDTLPEKVADTLPVPTTVWGWSDAPLIPVQTQHGSRLGTSVHHLIAVGPTL